ncbi:MAG: hypothetical protein R3236_07985 [Phycisphaeraceae bacterium]|nr:hypothetical protein [Phycisphaeraceae bacterium]
MGTGPTGRGKTPKRMQRSGRSTQLLISNLRSGEQVVGLGELQDAMDLALRLSPGHHTCLVYSGNRFLEKHAVTIRPGP